ncbi:hypothetical protein EI94DRAFT_1801772 [Lactarius quietus]|nr:hypothetical protein EI94DRAFT_1801772 [Lactarius quietus]
MAGPSSSNISQPSSVPFSGSAGYRGLIVLIHHFFPYLIPEPFDAMERSASPPHPIPPKHLPRQPGGIPQLRAHRSLYRNVVHTSDVSQPNGSDPNDTASPPAPPVPPVKHHRSSPWSQYYSRSCSPQQVFNVLGTLLSVAITAASLVSGSPHTMLTSGLAIPCMQVM